MARGREVCWEDKQGSLGPAELTRPVSYWHVFGGWGETQGWWASREQQENREGRKGGHTVGPERNVDKEKEREGVFER